MKKNLARDLISAGVHYGHGLSRWNPKMKPYIFGTRSKIHIINVKETLKGLLIAKKLLADVVSSGKDVIFVGTKRQAQKPVENAAQRSGMHYVSERWLGGMLTNFRTVRSRLQRLEQLEAMDADGKLGAESKKLQSRMRREMRKIGTNLGGVRKMERLPGAVVVVDMRKELIALREARKLGIVTIGMIDTDSDPDMVDVAIPANDDSIKAIEIILALKPSIVVVGMGTPRQEQFLVDLKEAGYNGTGYTCGGFFHQTAGKMDYYPNWADKFHLRWLYRIIDEPKLFKRYTVDYSWFLVVFLYDVIKYRISK